VSRPGVARRRAIALALALLAGLGAPALATAQGERDGRDVRPAINDAWITAKTKIALFADARVKARQVSVDTTRGTVALRGKVDSQEARAAAIAVATEVDGVKRVRSELQVVPPTERGRVDAVDRDLTRQVRARLIGDPALDRVDVRTDRGVATLRGNVASLADSARASETAARVPGVRAVRNELAYGPEIEARQRSVIGALLLFAAMQQKASSTVRRPPEPDAGQALDADAPDGRTATPRPAGPKPPSQVSRVPGSPPR